MNTSSVEELCDLGDQHLANEQWEEADNLFQQGLSRDAKSKRALLARAAVLRMGVYDYVQAQRLLRTGTTMPINRTNWVSPLDASAGIKEHHVVRRKTCRCCPDKP